MTGERSAEESSLIVQTATHVSTILDLLAELKTQWFEDHTLLVRLCETTESVQERLSKLEDRVNTRASSDGLARAFEIVEAKADKEAVMQLTVQVKTNTDAISHNTRTILKYVVTVTGVVVAVVGGFGKIVGWW